PVRARTWMVDTGPDAGEQEGVIPSYLSFTGSKEGGVMKNDAFDRRSFLKGAVAGSAAAVAGALPQPAEAQQRPAAPASASPAYPYLNLEEPASMETLVAHRVRADESSPKGTDSGINVFIAGALARGGGKGDRLYMQGPWKRGVPNQGYQLPL